jgi:hypothetical protein
MICFMSRSRWTAQSGVAGPSAPSFDGQYVTPTVVVLPDPFPAADGAETGLVVQGKAGGLLEEDPRIAVSTHRLLLSRRCRSPAVRGRRRHRGGPGWRGRRETF